MEIPKIVSLYIDSKSLPKLERGMRKIKEGAYRIHSPIGSTIHVVSGLPTDYENSHYVYKGFLIRKYDSSDDINYLIVKPVRSDYLYYLYFKEGFRSINLDITPPSLRKRSAQFLAGNFLLALKFGATCIFKVDNQKFVLTASRTELKILYYGKDETVSVI